MAEITRRRTRELPRNLFQLLIPHPDGLQARGALAALEDRVHLSDYEKGTYESGGRRFDKVVRFRPSAS
jgi:restriction system protein